jgi:hypothetical protein
MDFWHSIYNFLGITDFIYFISSPELQDMLFPAKLIFVFFSMFFLAFIVYFMLNSSWLQYKFLEETTEFFSWKSYGLRQIAKQWNRIINRTESGLEADYKLAIIDAEDLLNETLENQGYEGKDFEDSIKKAGSLLEQNVNELLSAHEIRNSIVYNPDFKLSADVAKKTLEVYESAVNEIGKA